jgi:lipoprotein-anchoring transpeptidase ErfK/SrfK
MRGGAAILLSVLLLAGASACSRGSDNSAKPRVHPKLSPASAAQLPAAAESGRIFLTKAQLSQALASGTVDRPIKSLLAVDQPLTYGQYKWTDTAIPDGPTWVRIDLGTQLISVFRAGNEIGTAVIVYGGDNKQTPVGKLHILAKARDHRSSIYDASMPYTLRLTNDGVSIHGSKVRWGAATHGCIGVPLDFARHLFDATKVGDEVIILPTETSAAATS